MIVPMKKVTVVVAENSRGKSLKALRKAGLLHVEKTPGRGRAPEDLSARAAYLEAAVHALPAHKAPEISLEASEEEARALAGRIMALRERERDILAENLRHKAALEALEPWGDFEPDDIVELIAEGVAVRLIAADARTLQNIQNDEEAFFFVIRQVRKTVYGVLVYPGVMPDMAPEGLKIPEHSASTLRSMLQKNAEELADINAKLARLARQSAPLRGALARLQQSVEFEEIRSSLEEDEELAWFTGYIPAEKEAEFKALAAEQAWGTVISTPSAEDKVPTLVRNRRVVRPIQPVFALMGIVPGYNEADISFWFLAFLSMFVGIIMGDAAYGLIILALTAFFRIKSGKKSELFQLLGLFGLTTFVWGALTGTWFSSLNLVQGTALQKLVIPAIATYQKELYPGHTVAMGLFPGNQLNADTMVMWLSLFFGIVMLVIARVQNFLRSLPSPAAIAQLGWLSVVLGLYWLIMQLVLQLSPLPFLTRSVKPMVLGGMALVILFGEQQKGRSFFKGILEGLKNILPTLLGGIGAFGDIISFIRLYAVGLVGVALAQSFNEMAPRGGSLPAVIGAVLILTLGHTLNIVLNALSVLVHGVRLNVLEFSGHLDIEWAGMKFDPFRLRVPEEE